MKVKTLSERVLEDFPKASLKALTSLVCEVYPKAFADCVDVHKLHKAEADNALWNHRRALLQGGMRMAVEGHEGVTARIVWGKHAAAPHPWNHTQIEAGRVALVECKIQYPDAAPQFSLTRRRNAERNTQKRLFPPEENQDAVKETSIYAHLVHGCDPRQPDRPTFCMIRFLRHGALQWWDDHINLFAMFPDIFAGLQKMPPLELAPDEQIEDTFNPKLNDEKDAQ